MDSYGLFISNGIARTNPDMTQIRNEVVAIAPKVSKKINCLILLSQFNFSDFNNEFP